MAPAKYCTHTRSAVCHAQKDNGFSRHYKPKDAKKLFLVRNFKGALPESFGDPAMWGALPQAADGEEYEVAFE